MTARRAFTLIEVMIGVLVLALGLLGLGAILPVVVREQRTASDRTLGQMCLADAKTFLTKQQGWDPTTLPVIATVNNQAIDVNPVAWDCWINDRAWGGASTQNAQDLFLWNDWVGRGTGTQFSGNSPTNPWQFSLQDNTFTPIIRYDLNITDRLWPSSSAQTIANLPIDADPARPRFVWDIVARRVQYGDLYARARTPALNINSPEYKNTAGKPDILQVAIFVRRIDQNIRIPRNGTTPWTLLDGILGTPGGSPLCPCAVDINTKLPTNNGVGEYGQPIIRQATFADATRNWIVITDGTANDQLLASQPGQKIIDNLGNVYTVVTPTADDLLSAPGGGQALFLDHPVPSWVVDPTQAPNSTNTIRQVVYMAQIPVAVDVMTITRPVANVP